MTTDKVIIYDATYDPAVTGAIAAGNTFDLPTLNSGPDVFIIEEMYIWPSYTVAGLPADVDDVQVLVEGQPFPSSPSRMFVRAQADRIMANPYDQRFAIGPYPFGKISTDPLEDTTLKIAPAQNLAIRIHAGTVAGMLVTDSPLRIMLRGRIAETDSQIQDIYGGTIYQPGGGVMLGDPVTGKVTPLIVKSFPITIDNVKLMAGATSQNNPKITPFWAWSRNAAVIPATPEYPYSFSNPINVARPEMDLRFDWTRVTSYALQVKALGAYIAAGRGRVWLDQPPLRRPGFKNLFHGFVVSAGFPNLLPGGGGPTVPLGANPMFQGPYELVPKVLAFNNLTELRVTADPGTTILANNLEVQLRGTHLAFG